MENADVKEAVEAIREQLSAALLNMDAFPSWVSPEKLMEATIVDYFDTAGISHKGVVCKEVYHGWSELYPSWWSRVIAKLMALTGRARIEHAPRWYHTLLPYSVELYISDTEEPVACYKAELRVPYKDMQCEFVIQPVTPLEVVTINVIARR